MEAPRLGAELELQLPAYTTATRDLSRICDLHHSSQQCLILNPLSEARDGTHNLRDTSWVLNPLNYNGNTSLLFFYGQQVRSTGSPLSGRISAAYPYHKSKVTDESLWKPQGPHKSWSQPAAFPLSLPASQLKQSSPPPQRWAAGCVSENVTASKLQEAEWKAGCARTTRSLALLCSQVRVWSAEIWLLIKLGVITTRNQIWQLATWPINKLLCE